MSATSKLLQSFWRRRRLPVVLQTEAAECGLACLCMVAGYWGHQIDLAHIRRKFSVSIKGVTFSDLMTMARGLAMQSRAIKLDISQLRNVQLPCVLHWDMNHLVVLKSIGSAAVIHDPAGGERRLSLDQLNKHFSGAVLELLPTAEFSPKRELLHITVAGLTGKIIGLHGQLVHLVLLGLLLQVCAMVMPFYLQWVVDDVMVTKNHDLLTVLGVGFILLMLLQGALGGLRSWAASVLTVNLNFQWLGNTFAHLLRLPMPYFEKRHVGDIMSRFGSIHVIQQNLTTQFVEGVIDGVLASGTLIMLLLYSGTLATVVILTAALYVGLRWAMFRPLREASAEQIIHIATQQTHLLESIRGVQSLRLFDRTEQRKSDWMNLLAEQFNAELRVARFSVSCQAINAVLFGVERIVVIWLAALAVLDARFSVGMLFAFISYKDQFSQRFTSLVDKLFELSMMRLHAERLADIVYTKPEPYDLDLPIGRDSGAPSIEIRNLAFRYSDGEPYIVRSLNLTIPARQCVAITGASGCGKTTLIKLLLGLLEPGSGEILVGGVWMRPGSVGGHRTATVMQGDQLFSASIADNICFFDTAPDFALIRECAELAAIHDEIAAMPMRYNTLVGDIGSGLSGGQQQRILLARAMYKKPGLLILDEATSHLDLRNERLVNEAIRKIPLTRIIIAHRPDTIAMAERVIELHDGVVVQDRLQQ